MFTATFDAPDVKDLQMLVLKESGEFSLVRALAWIAHAQMLPCKLTGTCCRRRASCLTRMCCGFCPWCSPATGVCLLAGTAYTGRLSTCALGGCQTSGDPGTEERVSQTCRVQQDLAALHLQAGFVASLSPARQSGSTDPAAVVSAGAGSAPTTIRPTAARCSCWRWPCRRRSCWTPAQHASAASSHT